MADSDGKSRKTRPTYLWFPLLLIAICIVVEYLNSRSLPVQGNLQRRSGGDSTETFRVNNARSNLDELTAFGPRVTGSGVNEVAIPQYIQRKVHEIAKDLPTGTVIEVERQNPASNFYLDFLGGITNVYQNVTNVVVRLSWQDSTVGSTKADDFAVLLNAHYDSVPGSPGAADDGIGVACMLEALRILAHGPRLRRPIIMLFNGAEESNHQAAHGFITQHRWAPTVKYVINLEAIGSGGKEMMFQCNSGWLAGFYGQRAPHPHAAVMAHELFKNFLHRMASTDWSTLIRYGSAGIRGLDTAYIENGYVYHTSFDTPSAVPDGTLVNTGENILHLTKSLATAAEVPNLTQADPVDELGVFFDLWGMYFVAYTGRNVTIIHSLVAIVGFAVVALLSRTVNNMSWSKLGRIMYSEIYCYLAPVVVTALVGGVLYFLAPMRWYDGGISVAMLIYGPPALLTILYTRGQASETVLNTPEIRLIAGLLWPWLSLLVLGVLFQVMSVYACCLWIATATVSIAVHTVVKHYVLRHSQPPARYLCSAECLYLVSMAPMLLLWAQVIRLFLVMTVPLLGKSGTVVPSDPAVGALIALLLSGPAPLVLAHELTRPVISKQQLRNWLAAIAGILLLAVVVLRPYSADRPKRLWIQHVKRTFISHPASTPALHQQGDSGVSSSTTECGLWVLGFDEQGMAPLEGLGVSRLDGRHKGAAACSVWDGDCYLKLPWYFSVSEALRDSHFIPADCPEGISPREELKLTLSSAHLPPMALTKGGSSSASDKLRVVKVQLRGPSHMHLVLRDGSRGARLRRWYIPNHRDGQLGGLAPLPTEDTAHAAQDVLRVKATHGADDSLSGVTTEGLESLAAQDQVLHFVPTPPARAEGVHFLSVGFGLCSVSEGCLQDVYLLVEGDAPVEVAAYGHYTDQKEDTAEIKALLQDLPKWSKGAEWTKFPSLLVRESA